MADIGDYLKNGPWDKRWTCPACYHDHHGEVTACEGCGIALSCTIEREPVAICTIVAPNDRDET
ncbi:hypothetical protein [Sphingomonas sanguinis]|uniref:RanBP2-type domain-containing protein n=1 Tax=Sphingomonas sanguinis TaxID=33051 RepID=A0A147HTN2_9SPHN|nr:hypothetical protein [Sphingomonas sanguinis]KTT68245.1 hypothetical protein NS319_14760 [Sphingomonas sanguinis]